SSSKSSRTVHRRSAPPSCRNLCSDPSTNRNTSVAYRRILSDPYCATAPVFNTGKLATSRLAHHIRQHARFEHRLPHGHRDVLASIQERPAVHRLHIYSDLRR